MNTIYKNPFKKMPPPPPDKTSVGITNIPAERIRPNPSQPRFIFDDEPMLRLADSIRRYGILQPISVRPIYLPDSEPVYQIIAGERRWRAARIIGMKEIPCTVLDIDDKKSAELAIIENIQREDLNIFEQAAAISSLIDIYDLTQEQAARQLSASQSYVANKLRILKLTPKERSEIVKHNLTERHARALLRLDTAEARLEVIKTIAAKELNVSATDRYIDSILEEPTAKNRQNVKRCPKELKFFFNSIEKSADLLRKCGMSVETRTEKTQNDTVVHIRIANSVPRETS